MRYQSITYPDVNNGIGFRVTLWVSGCTHHCLGCQNSETWNFLSGKEFGDDAKKQVYDAIAKSYIKGLTLSGGDPMDSYGDVLEFVKEFKDKFPEKDIWLYTGYTIEQLLDSGKEEILEYVDTIVDGEYHESERDITLPYRGSKNQRLISVKDYLSEKGE